MLQKSTDFFPKLMRRHHHVPRSDGSCQRSTADLKKNAGTQRLPRSRRLLHSRGNLILANLLFEKIV